MNAPWTNNRITPTHVLMTAATLIIIGAIGYFLSAWRTVLIPVAISLIVWFLIAAAGERLHRAIGLPRGLAQLAVTCLLFLISYVVGRIIYAQFLDIQGNAARYQDTLTRLIERIGADYGFEVSDFNALFAEFNFFSFFQSLAGAATGIITTSILIFLYVLLLSFEQHLFPQKLNAVFGNKGDARKTADSTLAQIQDKVQRYLVVKTIISLMTGAISCAIMLAVGVEYAIFWAFLIFLLNYIPNIGSVIAVILPVLMTLIETESLGTTLGLALALTIVQQTFGSVIEPRLMGSSLNISPFVVLVSLTVWGSMWGITGMFLCVPLTVVAMIVMAEFPNTRPIALLLSRDGNMDAPPLLDPEDQDRHG